MNKLLLVYFCLLPGSVIFSQPALQGDTVTTESYLDYYNAMAVAEEFVVTENFPEAIKKYKTAFDEYTYNNPIDCYIAAQVSGYIGDTATCLGFLYKGLSFGLPVQTIRNNPHLLPYFAKVEQNAVDSCWHIYQSHIDHRSRSVILSLIRYDQSIIYSHALGGIYDYRSSDYVLKKQYRPIWDSLVNEVITLTKVSGFPAQKIIGTQNGDDSLFRPGPNAVFALYIFIHHGNAWHRIGDLLWAELKKGNITPQMYGVIYESSNGKQQLNTSIHYFASRPCVERKCLKFVKNNLAQINIARERIGLCNYSVMEKKFASENTYYRTMQKNGASIGPFFDFQCELNFQGLAQKN